MIKVFRNKSDNTGILAYNGTSIKIRTGSNANAGTEWVTGKSGCPTGSFWLWNDEKYIKQPDDLDATGKEIGRFYPISSHLSDICKIYNKDKTAFRSDIGLHDENDIAGSAGCIVVVDNKEWRELVGWLKTQPKIMTITVVFQK